MEWGGWCCSSCNVRLSSVHTPKKCFQINQVDLTFVSCVLKLKWFFLMSDLFHTLTCFFSYFLLFYEGLPFWNLSHFSVKWFISSFKIAETIMQLFRRFMPFYYHLLRDHFVWEKTGFDCLWLLLKSQVRFLCMVWEKNCFDCFWQL